MDAREIRGALAELSSALRRAGKTTAAGQVDKVLSLIGVEDNLRWSEVVERAAMARQRRAPSDPSGEIVTRYLGELRKAGTNRASFEVVRSALQKDKAVRKAEMLAIAAAYTGFGGRFRTKAAALDEIVRAFGEKAHDVEKMKLTEGVTPW